MHFFDEYPQFYESGIVPNANRLRCRYDAIIKANREVLRGARVLDVASHNGRWSVAAILGGGASHVVGVEPRADLVEVGYRLATEVGIADQVEYKATTVMDYIEKEQPPEEAFDVVMCNGYFYHTCDHFQLLHSFSRIGRHLILDTEVAPQPGLAMTYVYEKTENIGNAVSEAGEQAALVGRPTKALLTAMLKVAGYGEWTYFNWRDYDYPSKEWMKNYVQGHRVTLRASR